MQDTRVIGTETEYGVYRPGDPQANAVALSTEAVQAYAKYSRGGHLPGGEKVSSSIVEWDYRGEDPLNDLRGHRLARASVDPSLLTDDPYHLAPSGGSELLPRPTEAERRMIRPTAMVIANGGRLYVDHAHPEYSSPEVSNALDAVLWDRAGEVIARRIMEEDQKIAASEGTEPLVLVKNNTDGKGATYGTHENYQVSRLTDLDDLIRLMIPFLVTRPILCGAGRVGLGQASETPGFQISQRADYVENDIGLETTFNRPIFNTRDEPHADGYKWRRIHVIGGDANQFDVSILLRTGCTALTLWAIEQGIGLQWEGLDLADPVSATQLVSRDLSLRQKLLMQDGKEMTALEIQQRYLNLVKAAFVDSAIVPDDIQQEILEEWQNAIDGLSKDIFSMSAKIEWVGKYQLLSRQKQRMGLTWDDPRLAAFDLQWADLRPDKSLVSALDKAGMVERLFTADEVVVAADKAPSDTRAHDRGQAVLTKPDLVKASWTSLVFDDLQADTYRRIPLVEPGQSERKNN